MKKIITIILTSFMIGACSNTDHKVEKVENVDDEPRIKVEKLMGEVRHGLNKVELNDSTTILIYRGVESCTMLQLK